MTTSDYLTEYMRIHLISIEQDLENIAQEMESLDPASKDYAELDFEYNHLSGQRMVTAHYLSVADDRMKS